MVATASNSGHAEFEDSKKATMPQSNYNDSQERNKG